jgi:hypothetical protein
MRRNWNPKGNIFNLELRYIIIHRLKNIVRQNYIYFGETSTDKFVGTDKGKLYWTKEDELLDKGYTQTHTAMMQHYINRKKIIVGIAGKTNEKLRMNRSKVGDFE